VEADLSGHPQNERLGPLAFFYLVQNVCNLEHDQETEVHQALYKVRLLEFPGANISQYVQLWRLITSLLIGHGVDVSDGPKAFKRKLKTVKHEDFIFDVCLYECRHPSADLNTLFTEAIRLFNKHKGTWTVTTKVPSVFHTEDTKKAANSPPKRTKMTPGMLKTHNAAGNPIDRKPPGPGESPNRHHKHTSNATASHDTQLWPFTLQYAALLYNYTPKVNNLAPIEIFTHQMTNCEFL
jgi:hypothetical protein